MTDEETKQILRELLATQKEQSELLRQMQQSYDNQTKSYDESATRYREHLSVSTFSTGLRALALLVMAAALAYLVFFGLHKH